MTVPSLPPAIPANLHHKNRNKGQLRGKGKEKEKEKEKEGRKKTDKSASSTTKSSKLSHSAPLPKEFPLFFTLPLSISRVCARRRRRQIDTTAARSYAKTLTVVDGHPMVLVLVLFSDRPR